MEKMTMKEFKEKYDEAVQKVLSNPVKGLKGEKEASAKIQVQMMLTGVLLFHQLEKELFGEEEEC